MTTRPTLFVGASVEGLDVARKVRAQLRHDAEVTLWNEDVFRINESTLDSLFRQLDLTDFAALVLSPDDLVESRGQTSPSPRDNVLLELGLFLGRLGRRRAFATFDSDSSLKLPSDLLGITLATYKGKRSDGNLLAAVGEACDLIREVIRTEGPRIKHSPPPTTRPAIPPRRQRVGVVWVLGSHGSLPDEQRTRTQRLLAPLAAGLVNQGLRVVMGESDMLRDLAARCREASLALPSSDRVTTMLFGNLRQPDIKNYFAHAIGAEPDIAILLGGNTARGRTREEYELAVTNGIPVLAVPATGGVAALSQSTVDLTDAERRALDALDFGDLSRAIVAVVSRYAAPMARKTKRR